MSWPRTAFVLVALCLVIGASGGTAWAVDGDASQSDRVGNETTDVPPDPDEDRIGWEGGYWYNESIDVDQYDGLSDAELQRYKYRTMARLERIRGLEFTDDVAIEFIGPGEVEDRIEGNITQFRGTGQQWEALFVIGEDRNAERVLLGTLVGSVAGWAAEEGSETVVLITDDPSEPTVPPTLLAHELVHVLQHQQFDLSAERYQRATLDGEHAKDAVVEGEASYLDSVYEQYCTNGSWDCADERPFATGPDVGVEYGLFPYLQAPYTLGGEYVSRLVDRGGFDAVDAAHRNPPEYSVTALHGRQAETASQAGIAPSSPLSVPDRSADGWTRQGGPDRVGAMGLTAILGDRALAWRNGVLYAYANGSADGYVWETRWSNATTAQRFLDAYRDEIRSKDGVNVSAGVWQIPDGPFADAFALDRTGDTVRIVNAPSVGALSAVHDSPSDPDGADAGSTVDAGSQTTASSAEQTTAADGSGPGFGFIAALVAVFVAIAAAKRSAV